MISSFNLASRWNLELCVESDHFVLKLLLHLVQSCLDNRDECLDAVWRFKAAIVWSFLPQVGQLIGPSAVSMISSVNNCKKKLNRIRSKREFLLVSFMIYEIKFTILQKYKFSLILYLFFSFFLFLFDSRENKYH